MWNSRTHFQRASLQLISDAQKSMEPVVLKTKAAQGIFLSKHTSVYSESEVKIIRYFLDAFLYKYQLANYSLEQLWAIRDAKIESNILDIATNSITSLDLTDDEVFLASHNFEQFLFQSRSCLDFFMLYLAHLLRTSHEGSISTEKFYKRLSNAQPDLLSNKARQIEEYFKTNVFGNAKDVNIISPTNWGSLLKSLRDKIAHKDRINMSKNSPDRIMNDILLDFPTLKDLTYDRFCQAMENGMWFMINDLFPIIYDLEWQAGPYREGMFDT